MMVILLPFSLLYASLKEKLLEEKRNEVLGHDKIKFICVVSVEVQKFISIESNYDVFSAPSIPNRHLITNGSEMGSKDLIGRKAKRRRSEGSDTEKKG